VIGQRKAAPGQRWRGRGHAAWWAAATALLAAGCSTQLPATASPPAARTVLTRLSPAQLAGQRVIYSYTGVTPPARLLTLVSHGEAAGVIFFTDNVGGPGQLAAAVRELDQAAGGQQDPVHLPLLLMTDQEGGIVRRLPGPPELSAQQIGASADPASAATQAGSGAALTLRSNGLNVNLAPVLDVYRQPGNFISHLGRSFASNPVTVATLGADYATAEQRGGVAATAKHFPGLGAAALPQDTDLRPPGPRVRKNSLTRTRPGRTPRGYRSPAPGGWPARRQ
jgi:beta-N-acetylhexosaminidase